MGLGALAYGLQKGMDDAEALRRARAMEDFNMAQSKRALEMREQAFPLALEQAQTANALSRQRLEEEQAAAPQRAIQLGIQTREMQANEAVAQRSRQLRTMLQGAHVAGLSGDLSGFEGFYNNLMKDFGGGSVKLSEGADEDGVPSILATITRPDGTATTRTIRSNPEFGTRTPIDQLSFEAYSASDPQNMLAIHNKRAEIAAKQREEEAKLAGQKVLEGVKGEEARKTEEVKAKAALERTTKIVEGAGARAAAAGGRKDAEQRRKDEEASGKAVDQALKDKPGLLAMMNDPDTLPLRSFMKERALGLMDAGEQSPQIAGAKAVETTKVQFDQGTKEIAALPKDDATYTAGLFRIAQRYKALGWTEQAFRYMESKARTLKLKKK